jgi:dTDP-4-amino-4,6-dideoxygalactose transaminase
MAGHLGDVACLSFNGNKIITTGGGGMIVTDSQEWADRARYLTTQARDDSVEYIHDEIGYNYRLTNMQAAMGVAQLERLDDHVMSKRQTAGYYDDRLGNIPGITIPREAPWARSNAWLYTILVDEAAYGMSSRDLMRKLRKEDIESRPLWRPGHRQPPYRGCQTHRIEVADRLYEQGLSLPCSVGIAEQDLARVISSIIEATPREYRNIAASSSGEKYNPPEGAKRPGPL